MRQAATRRRSSVKRRARQRGGTSRLRSIAQTLKAEAPDLFASVANLKPAHSLALDDEVTVRAGRAFHPTSLVTSIVPESRTFERNNSVQDS